MSEHKKRIIYISIFLTLTATIFVYGWYKHDYRCWDIIPYISCIKSYENYNNFEEIHKATYDLLEKEIPEEYYNSHCRVGHYGIECKRSPEALRQTLNFYSVKPAFNYFNYLITQVGVSELTSIYINTYFFSILIYILIFIFIKSYTTLNLAYLLTPTVFILSRGNLLITVGTPDSMLTFFSLLALYLILIKKKYWIGLVLILFSIFIRNDNILRYFIIISLLFYSTEIKIFDFKKYIYFFIIGIFTFFIHRNFFPGHDWTVLYYHSCVEFLEYPLNSDTTFNFIQYIKRVIAQIHNFLEPSIFLIFVIPPILLFKKSLIEIRSSIILLLLIGSLGFLFIRHLIFPVVAERYFYFDTIVSLIFGIKFLYEGYFKENQAKIN